MKHRQRAVKNSVPPRPRYFPIIGPNNSPSVDCELSKASNCPNWPWDLLSLQVTELEGRGGDANIYLTTLIAQPGSLH